MRTLNRLCVSSAVAAASVAAVLTWATPSWAALRFTDDFNSYTNGNLVGQGPWLERDSGGATPNPIQVLDGRVPLNSRGQDVVAAISPITSFNPAVNPEIVDDYAFFLGADVIVDRARAAGDYFLHTSGSTTSSSFQSRIYVRSEGDGFVFGVGVTSNPPSYGTEVLAFGRTYRVVARYDVIPGASNDVVRLFVDPLNEEPDLAGFYAINTQSSAGDASGLGAVNIRQGGTATDPIVTIDNLRVSEVYFAQIPEPASVGLLALTGLVVLRRVRGR